MSILVKQNIEQSYWILMADIIDSGHSEAILMQNELKNCVEIINEKYKKKLISPLTITLGDEFQGVSKNLPSSIDIVTAIEELIVQNEYSFRLRYVVNFGRIDTPINTEIAYGMLGEGLTQARELINTLKKSDNRFYFDTKKLKKNIAINDAFVVYDRLITKWQSSQDKAMASLFLQYPNYKLVAQKTGLDRSQVWKRQRSLEINSYFAIKNVIRYISK